MATKQGGTWKRGSSEEWLGFALESLTMKAQELHNGLPRWQSVGVEGVNGNVEGANGGTPDFLTIISQQLQNLLPAMLAQVSNRGDVGNQNGNVVNENVQENVGNVIVNGNRVGCSYKEFLACNPKEYDGKGGAVVLTRWIKKMESVHDMSGCSIDQKVKYTAGSFMGKALTWWNSQICTLSREVAVSMSWNNFKFMMIQEFCPSHEMQKLESELWNHAMVGAGHAAYTDRFHELERSVPHLVTPESRMIERYVYGLALQTRKMVAAKEPKTIQKVVQISGALTDEVVRNGSIKKIKKRGNNTGTWPKCTTCNSYHAPSGPCRTCFNCNRPGHLARDCKGVPRNVNPVNARNPTVRACYECGSTDHVRPTCPRLNRARGPEENRPNQVATNNEGQGRRNQGNQARGKAFMLGAEEARQDPNIITGTFTLNNHFATTLFDSGAAYSFVSTTFIPLLGLEPSELGFKYEIEIASRQLVEINKVIKGCKLEIEGHVFDIDLIPFGYGSFDVIIGIDWLSNYKVEIICHKKVVMIPLPYGNVLRVVGRVPNRKARLLMSAKASDKKQEEIVVVRYFPEFILEDGSLGSGNQSSESGMRMTYQRLRLELVMDNLSSQFIENFSKIAKSLTILTQKSKTFDWDEEHELAFQTLKGKLCNAPVLALPDGSEDFVKELNITTSLIELFSDYNGEFATHPGKVRMWWLLPLKMRKVWMRDDRTEKSDGELYTTGSRYATFKAEVVSHRGLAVNARALWDSVRHDLAYHTRTDGQSERTIQNLEDMLRALSGEGQLIGTRVSKETNENMPELRIELSCSDFRKLCLLALQHMSANTEYT
ncbi:putative reverse transcriptase domain-containing protein [Tanacetum coccineum]|uniref:Reverse transcriptase domain-containing protein n=1 Tax=Tanacetum coccineum TaxID=301880 RepID=A0ABQ4XYJ0_9ASTR